jgi:hypothetical protein
MPGRLYGKRDCGKDWYGNWKECHKMDYCNSKDYSCSIDKAECKVGYGWINRKKKWQGCVKHVDHTWSAKITLSNGPANGRIKTTFEIENIKGSGQVVQC